MILFDHEGFNGMLCSGMTSSESHMLHKTGLLHPLFELHTCMHYAGITFCIKSMMFRKEFLWL